MFKRLAVIAALLAASGCAPELTVKIYIADAIEALDSDEVVFTPVELAIPSLSRDNCIEDSKQISRILAEFVKEPQFRQCATKEMFTYGQYTANLPMVPLKRLDDLDGHQSAYTVALHKSECRDDDCVRIGIALVSRVTQKEVMKKFSRLSSAMFFEGKNDPLVINFQIENDTREEVRAVADHGFLNGLPSFVEAQDTIAKVTRRETVVLRLSDAGSSNLALGHDAIAGYLLLPPH